MLAPLEAALYPPPAGSDAFTVQGLLSSGVPDLKSPISYGTPYKKGPKKDPNLENYPYNIIRRDAPEPIAVMKASTWGDKESLDTCLETGPPSSFPKQIM